MALVLPDLSDRTALVTGANGGLGFELSKSLATHDLAGALFLEGGPEATLVAGKLSRVGSYETGFVENDDNHVQWALPNVLGIR